MRSSIENPYKDKQINTEVILNVLNFVRKYNSEIAVLHLILLFFRKTSKDSVSITIGENKWIL